MNTVAQSEGIGKEIFCPIDLHQEEMLLGLAIDRGEVKLHRLPTDDEGISALVKLLNSYRERHSGSRVWVAYEASGSGFLLADRLHEEGFEASVLAPTNLPVTPRSRSRKTDKRDVIRILEVLRGHVLAGNELPAVWIPSRQLRDDRELVRHRLSLAERSSRIKNSIHGLLRRYGVKKPEGENWTQKHRRWLISVAAELEIGAAKTLLSLLRELEFLELELEQVEQELIGLASEERYSEPVKVLTAMKGIGLLTALVFLTELGDLSRFGNRRKLAAYLGLAPRSWESGEDDDRKGHISKMGPSRVRKVLNQAAWSVVRWDPEMRAWFKARAPKKADRKKMIVAIMRRLAIRMWHTAQDTVRQAA
jgi:transposase